MRDGLTVGPLFTASPQRARVTFQTSRSPASALIFQNSEASITAARIARLLDVSGMGGGGLAGGLCSVAEILVAYVLMSFFDPSTSPRGITT
jgi:hypothetical protein